VLVLTFRLDFGLVKSVRLRIRSEGSRGRELTDVTKLVCASLRLVGYEKNCLLWVYHPRKPSIGRTSRHRWSRGLHFPFSSDLYILIEQQGAFYATVWILAQSFGKESVSEGRYVRCRHDVLPRVDIIRIVCPETFYGLSSRRLGKSECWNVCDVLLTLS
jgi:hypothetical protein